VEDIAMSHKEFGGLRGCHERGNQETLQSRDQSHCLLLLLLRLSLLLLEERVHLKREEAGGRASQGSARGMGKFQRERLV
jgi:hypothetical protein